jgi:NSS family neurotransmitter:Na+ symporter
VRSSFFNAPGDTLVAILAGFVTFPLVFTFALQPSAGLIFQTLPSRFLSSAGRLLAFFILVSFAALTSAISLLEVACAYFVDERGWPGKRASWTLGTVSVDLGLPPAGSGAFLEFMDGLATNDLLPLEVLLITVFTGREFKQNERKQEFTTGEFSPSPSPAGRFTSASSPLWPSF